MNTKKCFGFLNLGLLAFLGLGLELLLAFLIEPLIYGKGMSDWGANENIFHWLMTCAVWGIAAALLLLIARKKLGYSPFAPENAADTSKEKLTLVNYLILLAVLAVSLVGSVLDWGGLKVVKEFQGLGIPLFIFQYLYYVFEMALTFLVVAFGQKAGELFFKAKRVPWGGILAGITWGLVHALTKGTPEAGLLGLLDGIAVGIGYLAAKRKAPSAYLVMFLSFIGL